VKFLIKANVPHRLKTNKFGNGGWETVSFGPDEDSPLKASLAYYIHNLCLELWGCVRYN